MLNLYLIAGPSGHGKSHLASKSLCLLSFLSEVEMLTQFPPVGSLLQSPLYIVNMTNLRTQEDLMHAKSLARESDVRASIESAWRHI